VFVPLPDEDPLFERDCPGGFGVDVGRLCASAGETERAPLAARVTGIRSARRYIPR
jgi:hypothetical protein